MTDETRTLTALGRQQARILGKYLSLMPWTPTRLFVSDMTRAQQTFDIILDQLPKNVAPILVLPSLQEGRPCQVPHPLLAEAAAAAPAGSPPPRAPRAAVDPINAAQRAVQAGAGGARRRAHRRGVPRPLPPRRPGPGPSSRRAPWRHGATASALPARPLREARYAAARQASVRAHALLRVLRVRTRGSSPATGSLGPCVPPPDLPLPPPLPSPIPSFTPNFPLLQSPPLPP